MFNANPYRYHIPLRQLVHKRRGTEKRLDGINDDIVKALKPLLWEKMAGHGLTVESLFAFLKEKGLGDEYFRQAERAIKEMRADGRVLELDGGKRWKQQDYID